MKLKNIIKEKISILIYNLSEPYLKVAKKIKKDYPDICVTLIQADAVLGKNDMEEYMTKRNIMRGNRLIELSKTVDKFVLFSKYLEEPLEIGKRPYLVSECIINPNTKKTEINNNHRKIFLYTGTLFPDYEIFEFCQAIAKNKNAEVWICGSGPESNKIEELSKVSDNVKFFGYVDKKTVEDLRDKCDFLFNSRKPTGTYTKYSFPSKTAEYMMSAKPVVMYKLEGVPDKYDEYLTYLDINKSFDEEIERILNLDYNELVKKAEQGRDFIIKTRNNVTVAKEIIEFIKK